MEHLCVAESEDEVTRDLSLPCTDESKDVGKRTNTSQRGLEVVTKTKDLDFSTLGNNTTLNLMVSTVRWGRGWNIEGKAYASSSHSAASRNRKDI